MPSVFPTGVTVYDPDRAYNMYVAFDGRDGFSHLIDMNGNEVHRWRYAGFPSEVLDPAVAGGRLGHIVVQEAGSGGHDSQLFNNSAIVELDWDDKVVWRWGPEAPGGLASQNHDLQRLANGNTLLVSSIRHAINGFAAPLVRDQVIYEVAPTGSVVWRWVASDHLEEFGFSDEGLRMIREGFTNSGASAGFLTINNMTTIGPNRWHDDGDARFHPDNIMIDSREGNFIAIIDKGSGKVVWRMGPYYDDFRKSAARRLGNSTVPRPVDQIIGQHDAHLISKGLPGAGNLLVFDNQGAAGFPPAYMSTFVGSRVLEVNPITNEIAWQYTGEDSGRAIWTFHSSFISSARRLPNGNTLINEGMNGRIFQVTSGGEIVWEYVSPFTGIAAMGGRRVQQRWIFRAQPVPYSWVPEGTPRSERRVVPPDINQFHVAPL